MNTVYKYAVPHDDKSIINLPLGAQILSFQAQGGGLYIWALVDTEAKTIGRMFRLAGTGHALGYAETMTYIGTAQLGRLVFHLFEMFL